MGEEEEARYEAAADKEIFGGHSAGVGLQVEDHQRSFHPQEVADIFKFKGVSNFKTINC